MGSNDKVASPSFTISKVYKTKAKELHHFDFYRLSEAGIMVNELEELLGDPHMVVVIEWAGVVQKVLPSERLSITFKTIDENSRQLTYKLPTSLSYLQQGRI
jgi:tRNA threonylcarbamoyladenosine biosynthesis protein TsaE